MTRFRITPEPDATRRTTAPDPALVYVYQPPERCIHEHTEPVWPISVRRHPVQVGDEINWFSENAWFRMCTHCTTVLPLNFGCTDCEWVEVQRLCDVVPQLMLGRPCKEHVR